MTGATGPWGNLVWTYDANGNRLAQQNGVRYTYSYDGNRLESVANGHIDYYRHDAAGNTLSDGRRDFVYNQNNRLTEALESDRTLAEYVYNGKGQRIIKQTGPARAKSASGQTIVYHYDINGRLIEETAGNGKLLADYVYLGSQPLAQIRKQGNGEETFYYHKDHLGTPKAMTDKLGKVVWNAEFDPFGNEVEQKGRKGGYIRSVENNLRFPGQYFDAETGLHYNYFRDYDPRKGRYVEADPIGFGGGDVNLYRYVQQNPIKFIDPLGLYSWLDLNDAWSHYCDGTQTSWTTSFGSIDWGDVHSRIRARITSMVGNGTCLSSTKTISFTVGAQTGGADRFIIGRHTIRVFGDLTINCDCSWSFNGSMSSFVGKDPYNFNPSNRGLVGESTTWVGRNRCSKSGRTFDIYIFGSEQLFINGP